MPVDGGPGDAELGGDLLDGVHAAAAGADFLVDLPGNASLAQGELGFLPASTAAGAGGSQADQVDAALLQLGRQVDEVFERST